MQTVKATYAESRFTGRLDGDFSLFAPAANAVALDCCDRL
jgi:hypothetical protein